MRCWIVRTVMGLLFTPNNATIDLTCYVCITEFVSLANNISKVTCCQSKAFVCCDIDSNTKILIIKFTLSTNCFIVLSANKNI